MLLRVLILIALGSFILSLYRTKRIEEEPEPRRAFCPVEQVRERRDWNAPIQEWFDKVKAERHFTEWRFADCTSRFIVITMDDGEEHEAYPFYREFRKDEIVVSAVNIVGLGLVKGFEIPSLEEEKYKSAYFEELSLYPKELERQEQLLVENGESTLNIPLTIGISQEDFENDCFGEAQLNAWVGAIKEKFRLRKVVPERTGIFKLYANECPYIGEEGELS